MLAGPAGTGKSRAALEYMHEQLLKYPGARALIVRKTRASLSEAALFTYEEFVLGRGNPIITKSDRRFRQNYHYPNGSQVDVGGLDDSQKIMSREYDIVYLQEAIEVTEHDIEQILTRLRNGVLPFQQLVMDCNPGPPKHWLKLRSDNGRTVMINTVHEDNARIFDPLLNQYTEYGTAYLEKLRALSGVRRARLLEGKWVAAENTVYEIDVTDPDIFITPFRIPKHWRRYRALDFGFTAPFVCLWAAVSPDDYIYIYRQIYHTRMLIETAAKQISSLSKDEIILATVADHDAEDRATLSRYGISTVPAYKDLSQGVQAVTARLVPGGGNPSKIKFFSDSLVSVDQSLVDMGLPSRLEEEFTSYSWQSSASGQIMKEFPLQKDDHGMDALRYLVCYLAGMSYGATVASLAPPVSGMLSNHFAVSAPLPSGREYKSFGIPKEPGRR